VVECGDLTVGVLELASDRTNLSGKY
jgi:hypothetical protein